jgi:hypothetical protein
MVCGFVFELPNSFVSKSFNDTFVMENHVACGLKISGHLPLVGVFVWNTVLL